MSKTGDDESGTGSEAAPFKTVVAVSIHILFP